MYADAPTIATDPIYVGPPQPLTDLPDGPVRVWLDEGDWIDDAWERDGDTLEWTEPVPGTVRVCPMVDVDEHECEMDYEE
jgi:hypothetical protein